MLVRLNFISTWEYRAFSSEQPTCTLVAAPSHVNHICSCINTIIGINLNITVAYSILKRIKLLAYNQIQTPGLCSLKQNVCGHSRLIADFLFNCGRLFSANDSDYPPSTP